MNKKRTYDLEVSQEPHDVSHVSQDEEASDGREEGTSGTDHGATFHRGQGSSANSEEAKRIVSPTQRHKTAKTKANNICLEFHHAANPLCMSSIFYSEPTKAARTCQWFINSCASVYQWNKLRVQASLPRLLISETAHYRKPVYRGLLVSRKQCICCMSNTHWNTVKSNFPI